MEALYLSNVQLGLLCRKSTSGKRAFLNSFFDEVASSEASEDEEKKVTKQKPKIENSIKKNKIKKPESEQKNGKTSAKKIWKDIITKKKLEAQKNKANDLSDDGNIIKNIVENEAEFRITRNYLKRTGNFRERLEKKNQTSEPTEKKVISDKKKQEKHVDSKSKNSDNQPEIQKKVEKEAESAPKTEKGKRPLATKEINEDDVIIVETKPGQNKTVPKTFYDRTKFQNPLSQYLNPYNPNQILPPQPSPFLAQNTIPQQNPIFDPNTVEVIKNALFNKFIQDIRGIVPPNTNLMIVPETQNVPVNISQPTQDFSLTQPPVQYIPQYPPNQFQQYPHTSLHPQNNFQSSYVPQYQPPQMQQYPSMYPQQQYMPQTHYPQQLQNPMYYSQYPQQQFPQQTYIKNYNPVTRNYTGFPQNPNPYNQVAMQPSLLQNPNPYNQYMPKSNLNTMPQMINPLPANYSYPSTNIPPTNNAPTNKPRLASKPALASNPAIKKQTKFAEEKKIIDIDEDDQDKEEEEEPKPKTRHALKMKRELKFLMENKENIENEEKKPEKDIDKKPNIKQAPLPKESKLESKQRKKNDVIEIVDKPKSPSPKHSDENPKKSALPTRTLLSRASKATSRLVTKLITQSESSDSDISDVKVEPVKTQKPALKTKEKPKPKVQSPKDTKSIDTKSEETRLTPTSKEDKDDEKGTNADKEDSEESGEETEPCSENKKIELKISKRIYSRLTKREKNALRKLFDTDDKTTLTTLSIRVEVYVSEKSWKSADRFTKELLNTFSEISNEKLAKRLQSWTKSRLDMTKKNFHSKLNDKSPHLYLFECPSYKYDESKLKCSTTLTANLNWKFSPKIKQAPLYSPEESTIVLTKAKNYPFADLQEIDPDAKNMERELLPLSYPLYLITTRDSFAYDLVEKTTVIEFKGRKILKTGNKKIFN